MQLDLGASVRALEVARQRGQRLQRFERASLLVERIRRDAAALLVIHIGDRLGRMKCEMTRSRVLWRHPPWRLVANKLTILGVESEKEDCIGSGVRHEHEAIR